jgi:protein-tyrosine-phosphatase
MITVLRLRSKRRAVSDGRGVVQSPGGRSRARAISAGTSPADAVHPEVVAAMRERGLDLGGVQPQHLTETLAAEAQWLITMGCGDSCPVGPGAIVRDWPLEDPHGRPPDEVRAIRDEIETRVRALVVQNGWG